MADNKRMIGNKRTIGLGLGFLIVLVVFFIFYMGRQPSGDAVSVSGFKLNTAVELQPTIRRMRHY